MPLDVWRNGLAWHAAGRFNRLQKCFIHAERNASLEAKSDVSTLMAFFGGALRRSQAVLIRCTWIRVSNCFGAVVVRKFLLRKIFQHAGKTLCEALKLLAPKKKHRHCFAHAVRAGIVVVVPEERIH